ncbi:hypothetical protein BBJ28_00014196 [Nothophytophthora sp. Chile5]|nr:hypothetical protein BBJ28_00014196 [Nothophytophthora sp. Chile5]
MPSSATERQLALGVKGRLSDLEMAQLRRQLAQAAAPGHQLQTRPAAAAKAATQRYRRVQAPPESGGRVARPGRKTLASIQHERQLQSDDASTSRPRPPRGLPSDAKQLLQDEYVAKPRAVSVIPRAFTASKEDGDNHNNQLSGGKRRGPEAVPQVFLM